MLCNEKVWQYGIQNDHGYSKTNVSIKQSKFTPKYNHHYQITITKMFQSNSQSLRQNKITSIDKRVWNKMP